MVLGVQRGPSGCKGMMGAGVVCGTKVAAAIGTLWGAMNGSGANKGTFWGVAKEVCGAGRSWEGAINV